MCGPCSDAKSRLAQEEAVLAVKRKELEDERAQARSGST